MSRKMADCRRFPSDSNCSLVIIGEGHEDTPEMREQLEQILEPAEAYMPGPRAQESLPG
jgi:hypothetical protein